MDWPICVSILAGRKRASKSRIDALDPRVDRRLCTVYIDSPEHSPEARIGHLRIMTGFHSCNFFVMIMLSTNAGCHLTLLDVGPLDLSDVQAVGKLLQNAGRTLRAVGIDLLGFEYEHDLDGNLLDGV